MSARRIAGSEAARGAPTWTTVALGTLMAFAPAGGLMSQQAAPRRSVPPSPARAARAPQAADTTLSYMVNGVRVVHRTVSANDIVAANVYLLGGTRQLTDSTEGIEAVLLELSERGTTAFPKARLRGVMARTGSTIVLEPQADWTMLGLRSTVATFDSTWAVLADRLMRPTLDPGEFALVREQFLSGASQRDDSPDALLATVSESLAFLGHPYARTPVGTEQSLRRLTLADLRRYHATEIVRSRLLVVIVGDVPRTTVARLVGATLARLPMGTYQWSLPDTLPARAPFTVVVPRQLPTNYLQGYFPGPPAGSPDYQALRVALAVLGGRLHTEVRERRNLTYAINAPFLERAVAAGGLYVTTVSPDSVLRLMRTEIEELQADVVPAAGLRRLVGQFITEYFLDNETNAEQADFLARAQLYRGDYRAGDRFVDELRAVSPADVKRVARRYLRNVRFAYIGDPRRLTRRDDLLQIRGR